MKKSDFYIGQKVAAKKINRRYGEITGILIYTVTKIGNKYFTAQEGDRDYTSQQFHIDTGLEKTDYSSSIRIVLNEEVFAEEARWMDLVLTVRKGVEHEHSMYRSDLTVDQLQRIVGILNETK